MVKLLAYNLCSHMRIYKGQMGTAPPPPIGQFLRENLGRESRKKRDNEREKKDKKGEKC